MVILKTLKRHEFNKEVALDMLEVFADNHHTQGYKQPSKYHDKEERVYQSGYVKPHQQQGYNKTRGNTYVRGRGRYQTHGNQRYRTSSPPAFEKKAPGVAVSRQEPEVDNKVEDTEFNAYKKNFQQKAKTSTTRGGRTRATPNPPVYQKKEKIVHPETDFVKITEESKKEENEVVKPIVETSAPIQEPENVQAPPGLGTSPVVLNVMQPIIVNFAII